MRERCGLIRILTLKDGPDVSNGLASVHPSKWNGPSSNAATSAANGGPNDIPPMLQSVAEYDDDETESSLVVAKPCYPTINMNMEDYV